MNPKLLQPLFDAGQLWQGQSSHTLPVWPSHTHALDQVLVGGGWPAQGLLECLTSEPSTRLVTLWLPVWQHLIAQGGAVALLNPPHRLSAEGLLQAKITPSAVHLVHCAPKDQAWALEQLTQAGTIQSILCCTEAPYSTVQLRRLHLAAQGRSCQLVLVRSPQAHRQPSPAPTRCHVTATEAGLEVTLLKQPGRPGGTVLVPHPRWLHPGPAAHARRVAKTGPMTMQ